MIIIFTDTPGVARQIARALNMDVKTGDDGYFYGRGFTLAWADRDLLSIPLPENRPAKSDLPPVPESLTPAVRKKKTTKGMITDRPAAKQLNIIKKLLDGCDSIIVATDAGEAGELHFRTLYSFLDCNRPYSRLWLHSLTAGAIREGFGNLRERSLYDNLYAAADCRAKADYLTGISAGPAFGLSSGLVNCPLGRLQTPVLAMIGKRLAEYRKFVPVPFHECHVTLEKNGLFQTFTLPGSIKDRRKAEKIHERMKAFPAAQVTRVEIHNRIQPAPPLYDLTALQEDAHARCGFPAAKTMETAGKLYGDRLISHPLTDARHIPGEVFTAIPKILRQTACYCGMEDCLKVMERDNLNRNSVQDGNSHPAAHYAIIPTGVYPGYLPEEDRAIYEMIVCRTLEAFAPDCQKEFIRTEAAIGSFIPVSEKSKIIVPGWRSVRNGEEDREWDETGEKDDFPEFTEGETVRIYGGSLVTRKTLPPTLYTEAGLLSMMEEAGLGTAATRTQVIESLLSCGYVERWGQRLVPAEKGQVVYNCVKNMRIADVKAAGGWERMLAEVSRGGQDAETFMAAFKIFTRQATEEISGIQKPAPAKKEDRDG
jgi:DNA topoisomerase-3